MAETSRLTTGGPLTSVDLGAIIPESQAQELGAARQAAGLLAQTSQALAERGQRFSRQAQEHFARIETTALELDRKTKAQDLILEATLKADEEVQSLLNTQGIAPLELANRSETILNKIANETVGKAASLGVEERDFVRQKVNGLKLHHVPGVRQTGYQRFTDEKLAGLQRRNFQRKAELYKPETSQERQMELMTEIFEDIKAHEGIALSAQDTEKMLRAEDEEFTINTFFETLNLDPQAAMKFMDDPRVKLDPRQKLQLKGQALNVLQAKENEKERLENIKRKAEKEKADKVHSLITDDIILNGKDPRTHLASQEVNSLLMGGDKQNLINFYEQRQSQVKRGKLSVDQATDFLRLKDRLDKGDMTNTEILGYITDQVQNGADISGDEMDQLYTFGAGRRKDFMTEVKGSFANEKKFAQDTIDDFFQFKPGFINIVEKGFRGQLQEAATGAKETFRRRIKAAEDEARKQGLDPFDFVDPVRVAEEVKMEFLPLAINALKGQKYVPEAYKQMISQGSLGLTKIEYNKIMQDHIIMNRLQAEHATTLNSAYKLQQEFNRLSGLTNVKPNEKPANRPENKSKILSGMGAGLK